eukprot:754811-Hanusia_phi.AAC.6
MGCQTSCNSGLVANEGISRCIQLLKRIKVAKWKIESKQLEYFAKRILEFCAVVARISGVATAMDIVSILQSRGQCRRHGLRTLGVVGSSGADRSVQDSDGGFKSSATAAAMTCNALQVLKFVDGQARETKPRDKPFADFLTSRMTANKPSRASGESLSGSIAMCDASAAAADSS